MVDLWTTDNAAMRCSPCGRISLLCPHGNNKQDIIWLNHKTRKKRPRRRLQKRRSRRNRPSWSRKAAELEVADLLRSSRAQPASVAHAVSSVQGAASLRLRISLAPPLVARAQLAGGAPSWSPAGFFAPARRPEPPRSHEWSRGAAATSSQAHRTRTGWAGAGAAPRYTSRSGTQSL